MINLMKVDELFVKSLNDESKRELCKKFITLVSKKFYNYVIDDVYLFINSKQNKKNSSSKFFDIVERFKNNYREFSSVEKIFTYFYNLDLEVGILLPKSIIENKLYKNHIALREFDFNDIESYLKDNNNNFRNCTQFTFVKECDNHYRIFKMKILSNFMNLCTLLYPKYPTDEIDEVEITTLALLLNILKEEFYNDIFKSYNIDSIENIIDNAFKNGNLNKDPFFLVKLIYYNKKVNKIDYNTSNLQVIKSYKEIEEKYKLQTFENELNNVTYNPFSIDTIDNLSGKEFEKLIYDLFTRNGYKCTLTKYTGDQGVDIIAENGIDIIAIQTKSYNTPVGNHAIMEVVAGKNYYKANRCIVITNNIFTKSAKDLAFANGVELWDRKTLLEQVKNN